MVRILILLFTVVLSCTIEPDLPMQTPIVVINFDDGFISQYTTGFTLMRQYNPQWTATLFPPVEVIGESEYVSLDQLREMEGAGWETGGHTVHHVNLTSVPPESAEAEVKGCFDYLDTNGLARESFAYPSGNFNDTVQTIVRKYFKNIRTANDYHYQFIDRYNLGYFAVKSGHTVDDIVARVEEARANREQMVVIGFHVILPDTAPAPPQPAYWCKESVFRGFCDYLNKEELAVCSVKDAMKLLVR